MAKRHITNLEELVDLLMRNATGVSLMEFVAFHRQPGENFLNWEALARASNARASFSCTFTSSRFACRSAICSSTKQEP